MRIGFISDLHMDYNTHHDYVAAFSHAIETLQLDKIIFCGDTTTGAFEALEFYDTLSERTTAQVLEIPGNHELYCVGKDTETDADGLFCLDADEYMYLMLNHPRYSLFLHPIVHHDWVVIGGPSWYDYSLHKNYLHMSERKKKRFLFSNPEYKYLQDRRKNPFINEKITAKSLILLEKQLKAIRESPNGDQRKICSVLHMLPLAELYTKKPIFNTTIAFMGSRYYGELYKKYHVDLCVCGHSHIRKQLTKDNTLYVNVSLGHNFKWTHKTNLYAEILETMYVLEI